MEQFSRRSFLKGAGLAAVGTAAVGLVGCGSAAAQEQKDWWMPEAWDEETDVVVVGYGAAGVAATITGLDAGLGVITLEKSSEPDGGNLGCATGCIQTCMKPDDADGMVEMLRHFNQGSVSKEDGDVLYPAIVEQEVEAGAWLDSLEDLEIYWVWRDYGDPSRMTGEVAWSERGDAGGSELFGNFHEIAVDKGADIRLATPAKRLVQNPETKEILGVVAEGSGGDIAIKAKKGVIMACGGFEGNPMMQQWYTGWGIHLFPWGTPHNTGDGHRMCVEAGAQLWHMDCSEIGSPCYRLPSEQVGCSVSMQSAGHFPDASSWLFVNYKGERFVNETKNLSHAPQHTRKRTVWYDMDTDTYEFSNLPYWMVFDQATFDAAPLYIQSTKPKSLVSYAGVHQLLGQEWTNAWALEQGWIVKADTIEELAAAMVGTSPSGTKYEGVDAAALAATVERWNAGCEAGADSDFKRDPETMAAFGDGPFYAIEMGMGMINTQGGPKHNEHNQTLDTNDEVIPRLYNVGEFGSLNGGNYNLGNIAEALTTGHFAMLHAGDLEPWDASDGK